MEGPGFHLVLLVLQLMHVLLGLALLLPDLGRVLGMLLPRLLLVQLWRLFVQYLRDLLHELLFVRESQLLHIHTVLQQETAWPASERLFKTSAHGVCI